MHPPCCCGSNTCVPSPAMQSRWGGGYGSGDEFFEVVDCEGRGLHAPENQGEHAGHGGGGSRPQHPDRCTCAPSPQRAQPAHAHRHAAWRHHSAAVVVQDNINLAGDEQQATSCHTAAVRSRQTCRQRGQRTPRWKSSWCAHHPSRSHCWGSSDTWQGGQQHGASLP